MDQAGRNDQSGNVSKRDEGRATRVEGKIWFQVSGVRFQIKRNGGASAPLERSDSD